MSDANRRISFCNERVDYCNDPAYKKIESLFRYLIHHDTKETEKLGVDTLLPAYADCHDGKMSVRQNCEMWIRDNTYTEAKEYESKFSARAIDARAYYMLTQLPIEEIARVLLEKNRIDFYTELTNSDLKFAEPTILDAPLTKELNEKLYSIGIKIQRHIVQWHRNRYVLWKGFTEEVYRDSYKI